MHRFASCVTAPGILAFGILALAGCGATVDSPAEGAARGRQPASLVRLGDEMSRSGDSDAALGFYRSALARDGRDAEALEHMGALLNQLRDSERAEQSFRAALVVDPANPRTQRGLAVSLLAQNRPVEALPMLRSLAWGSTDPQVLRDYGVALDLTGHSAEAQAAYRAGLQQAPANPALHGNLALSLAASGDIEVALAEARAAVSSPMPDPRQAANAVLVFALARREAEAREQGRALESGQLAALLARAGTARAQPVGSARAAALGLIAGS